MISIVIAAAEPSKRARRLTLDLRQRGVITLSSPAVTFWSRRFLNVDLVLTASSEELRDYFRGAAVTISLFKRAFRRFAALR